MRRWVSVAVTAVICVAALVLGMEFMDYTKSQGPISPSDSELITIEIGEGIGVEGIAKMLEDNILIKDAKHFIIRSTLERTAGKYKAGVYNLSRSMSVDEIMRTLVEGVKREVVKLTIPEGLTTEQTMQILTEAGLMTEEEFWSEVESGAFDYTFLKDAPKGRERLEGFLYPETYEVYKDAGAHAVIDMLLLQFDHVYFGEIDSDLAGVERGLTLREVVTIASLIERETAVPGERPVVARVIFNRLDEDMPLQIDAAIQYALGTPREQLTNKDLEIDSPYNVYKNKGLPPGPICNPRKDSLDAVVHPDDNDYIYYVLDPALNGMHRFSKSYDEFLSNKAAYQDALAERDAGGGDGEGGE
jgi:UPF0755 protein